MHYLLGKETRREGERMSDGIFLKGSSYHLTTCQGLSQDLETGCPHLAIIVLFFREITIY